MKKVLIAAILVSVCGTLGACSAKLEGAPGASLVGFTGDLPPVNKAPSPPDAGPVFTPPSQCVDLTGEYQMNSDSFAVTQSGCNSATWLWHGNDFIGTKDSTNAYTGDNVEREVTDATAGEQMFQKSHFETTTFIVDVRVVSAAGTQQFSHNYTLTQTPCILSNPEPGVTYLMDQRYVLGSTEAYACDFWARSK